ncbi:MAG: hypothetical protein EBZ48_04545 [Proteobacteria bacterium]|nr:hypothetical protein [Pseudomonadota bacterium]
MGDDTLYLPLGTLAAHTQAGVAGFRQREAKFFAELFSNWVNIGGIGVVHSLHNTQVSRFLSELVADGAAKLVKRGRMPQYRLTRGGIFGLLTKVMQRSYLDAPRDCLLVWYFLRSYTPQLRRIAEAAGSEFSKAHALELEQVLNITHFLARQIQFLDYEIQRLRERIQSTYAMHRDVHTLRAQGASSQRYIAHVSAEHPYELNSQRSFAELLQTIPHDVMEWELCEGAFLKARCVFEPILGELERFRAHLEGLRSKPI